jgi:hypothetical protein
MALPALEKLHDPQLAVALAGMRTCVTLLLLYSLCWCDGNECDKLLLPCVCVVFLQPRK